jgi:hypothetical protein
VKAKGGLVLVANMISGQTKYRYIVIQFDECISSKGEEERGKNQGETLKIREVFLIMYESSVLMRTQDCESITPV